MKRKHPVVGKGLLDKDKPRTTQLNKKMVVIVTGILLLVVLFIIFDAFRDAGLRNEVTGSGAISQANEAKANQNIAAGLPGSYQDSAAIDRLLQRNRGGKVSAGVMAELANLRSQQTALKSELAKMRAQSASGHSALVPPLTREAMSSAIFFAGGAPRPKQTMRLPNTGEEHAKPQGPGEQEKPSDYQKQNMQAQKLKFLQAGPDKKIYNENAVQYPVSKYEIQAGSQIPAILDTQINSDVPGMIVAIVTRNVYDSITGQYLLIPKGSKLIGVYNSEISYGQDILQAKFTRLIRPDGSSIVLPSQPAVNDMGRSGMNDIVNNHWGRIIGSAVLSALFNIPAIIATNQMNSSNSVTCNDGVCVSNPSLGSLTGASALQGVGGAASQVGTQLTQRSLDIQPTIVIRAGYRFSVMVSKDIVLPPYKMPFEKIPALSGA